MVVALQGIVRRNAFLCPDHVLPKPYVYENPVFVLTFASLFVPNVIFVFLRTVYIYIGPRPHPPQHQGGALVFVTFIGLGVVQNRVVGPAGRPPI